MTARRCFAHARTLVLCCAAAVLVCAIRSDAGQILLNSDSVIGGSGAWDTLAFDAEPHSAKHVVDNQTGSISEPEPTSGNFWLGRENTVTYVGYMNEHFVVDLGAEYVIDQIDLFNTHNRIYNDRGTKNFILYASNAVTYQNASVGYSLSDPAQILSGTLAFQVAADDPIEAQTFTSGNGLATGTAYRYLMFKAVNTFTPTGYGHYRSTGLNEIRVFGMPESPISTLSGLALSHGTLNPSFASAVMDYTAGVPNEIESLTLVPTVSEPHATVTVNGNAVISGAASPPIPLAAGANAISIVVTAQDGTARSYTLTVDRLPEDVLYGAFVSLASVPFTASAFTASGYGVSLSLGFAPPIGIPLTAINKTGLGFIDGYFSNLPQGRRLYLDHGMATYPYVANYYGGTGNDLVLQWAHVKAYSWGDNMSGQLGTGSGGSSAWPHAIPDSEILSGKTILALAAGSGHSLALCSDGTLAAWGKNSSGQLGDNTCTSRNEPRAVDASGALAGKTVIAIAAGGWHNLALCSDGTLAAWGWNEFGQLGNDSTSSSPVPVDITHRGAINGKTVVAIAAGEVHSLALCSDGTVAAWGRNSDGQLGDSTFLSSAVPRAVDTSGALAGKVITSISAGYGHSLALCSDGTLAAWGKNDNGQLGNNSGINSPVPVPVVMAGTVLFGKTVTAIASGADHNLALCPDGTLASWGKNEYGQLGNNSLTSSSEPVAVDVSGALNGRTVTALSAGYGHSVVLCSDGAICGWGNNLQAELGDGTTINRSAPVSASTISVGAGEKFILISVGSSSFHALGLTAVPLSANCSLSSLTASSGSLSPAFTSATTFYTVAVPNDVLMTTFTPTASEAGAKVLVAGIPVASGSASNPFPLWVGNNFFTVRGYAPDGIAWLDYTVMVVRAPSPVSTLAGLSLSGGTLSPAFSSETTAYTASVSHDATAVTVTPTVTDATATVKVNGVSVASGAASSPIPLPAGDYEISVVVTAQDGSSRLYRITLHRRERVPAVFTSASSVPVWAAEFTASGKDVFLLLGFEPPTGASLTVINNTGLDFIHGQFANLSHGQPVELSYNGVDYHYVANYYGGTGNDLVLQWARNKVYSWSWGDPVPVDVTATGALAGKTVIASAAGQQHSLALCSDGTLAAWGANNDGQLGNDSLVDSSAPVAVDASGALADKTVIAIAAGQLYSLALCSDGTLAAWGANSYGQLGNNSWVASRVPVAVDTSGALAGKTVIAVSAGLQHNLALCSDGSLVAWGWNAVGQLGNGNTTNSKVPVSVNAAGVLSGRIPSAIAAGSSHSGALCSDGALATWGWNGFGQLGNNSFNSSSVPVLTDRSGALNGRTIQSISLGYGHTIARCSDGRLVTWGNNNRGQLGNNSTLPSKVPVLVAETSAWTGKSVTTVVAADEHILALCSDGSLAASGYLGRGVFGNDSAIECSVPVAVSRSFLGLGEIMTVMAENPFGSWNPTALVALPEKKLVQVTASVPDAFEFGQIPGVFTIARLGTNAVSVAYSMTVDGVPVATGETPRFTTMMGPAEVPEGLSSVTVEVTPIPNDRYDGDAVVAITLLPADGYVICGSPTATLTIHDQPVDAWRFSQFGSGANDPEVAADMVINNPLGMRNLMAYALGVDPYAATVEDLPAGHIRPDNGPNYLCFSFTRNVNAKDVTYVVEVSTDLILGDWTPLATGRNGEALSGTGTVTETGSGTIRNVEVRDCQPVGAAPTRFMRFRVAR